jgi:hypothetical protein
MQSKYGFIRGLSTLEIAAITLHLGGRTQRLNWPSLDSVCIEGLDGHRTKLPLHTGV